MFVFQISDATKGVGKKSGPPKSKKKDEKCGADLSKLDDNAKEVAIKFKKGCECHDQNCFEGKTNQTTEKVKHASLD
jgi:hypothetical protein